MLIDSRGCACPEPVLKTKKALQLNPEGIEVLVDNNTAKENVSRFGRNQGYEVVIEEKGGEFLLKLTK